MSPDPVRSILGVGSDAAPEVLLALSDPVTSIAQIETAMRLRIGQTFRHRMGRTPEADRVRQIVRDAAQRLINQLAAPSPQPQRAVGQSAALPSLRPPSAAVTLSDFDRAVLGVLVSHGGWNASSRSRLVGIASQHGVSPTQLMQSITGLNKYARSGQRRIEISQISPSRSAPRDAASTSNGQPVEPAAPGSMRDPAWRTIQVSTIVGLLLIFAGIISVRTLLQRQQTAAHREAQNKLVAQDNRSAASPVVQEEPDTQMAEQLPTRTFRTAPTFLGNGLPAEATTIADDAGGVTDELDAIGNDLIVAGENVSEAMLQKWDVTTREIATAWPLLSMTQRNEVEAALLKTLMETRHLPDIGNRMLQSLTSPTTTLAEPLEVWRGAWMAGMLARIARNPGLSEALRGRATDLLQASLPTTASESLTFEGAAQIWLEDRVDPLVNIALNRGDEAFDYWELWLTALRKLNAASGSNRSLLHAVNVIMSQTVDLSSREALMSILGRLTASLDFNDEATRALINSLYISEQTSSTNLHVLTAILEASDAHSWFSSDMIVSANADMVMRRRMRDRMLAAWPTAQDGAIVQTAVSDSNPLQVDETLALAWHELVNTMLAKPQHVEDEKLIRRLVAASQLNEAAAAIVARENAHAEYVLDHVEAYLALPSGVDEKPQPVQRRPTQRIGQKVGADGNWAEKLGAARRNPQERLELLRSLINGAGTDLGPVDAEALVRELYRGASQELREIAQQVVLDRFARGPTVVLTMLDEFPNAPRTSFVSETVQRLTGRTLPHYRVEGWRADATLALVEHMLSLQDVSQQRIDAGLDPLIHAYAQQFAFLRGEEALSTAPTTPQEAAQQLCEEWLRQISQMMARHTELGTVEDIRQRSATWEHLARGPLQQFVARQLCVLDCQSYAAATEQPNRAPDLAQLLAARARDRTGAVSILAQAVEIEETMLLVWAARMGVDRFAAVSATEGSP